MFSFNSLNFCMLSYCTRGGHFLEFLLYIGDLRLDTHVEFCTVAVPWSGQSSVGFKLSKRGLVCGLRSSSLLEDTKRQKELRRDSLHKHNSAHQKTPTVTNRPPISHKNSNCLTYLFCLNLPQNNLMTHPKSNPKELLSLLSGFPSRYLVQLVLTLGCSKAIYSVLTSDLTCNDFYVQNKVFYRLEIVS
jgi:hypothetical protein